MQTPPHSSDLLLGQTHWWLGLQVLLLPAGQSLSPQHAPAAMHVPLPAQ
jgi:hypothetical protein